MAGTNLALADGVTPGPDGVGRRVSGLQVKEAVEAAEGSQAAVDGGGSVARSRQWAT
jgi:hypothetical protein